MDENNRPMSSRMVRNGIIVVIGVVALVVGVLIGVRFAPQSNKESESKSNAISLRFEDIGELATQAAYLTEVEHTDDSNKLFDISLPFTQSQYIYSYDIIIKAGLDFSQIEWEQNGTNTRIRMPEIKILSSELKPDSLVVYYENQSVFNPLTLKDDSEAMQELIAKAQTDAIANGLLENAQENAESLIREIIAQNYNPQEYTVTFLYK